MLLLFIQYMLFKRVVPMNAHEIISMQFTTLQVGGILFLTGITNVSRNGIFFIFKTKKTKKRLKTKNKFEWSISTRQGICSDVNICDVHFIVNCIKRKNTNVLKFYHPGSDNKNLFPVAFTHTKQPNIL